MIREVLLFLAVICSIYGSTDDRIYGGILVDIEKLPFLVSIQHFNKHDCGGSILNSRWILTAAHCDVNIVPPFSFIRVGTSNTESGGSLYKIDKTVIHPRSTEGNDVCLAKVTEDIQFNAKVQPIQLLHKNDPQVKDDTNLLVSGWGRSESRLNDRKLLRVALVQAINQTKCQSIYKKRFKEPMMCAGAPEGGKDACRGDSGGPLINLDGVQVGVVSWGKGCGLKKRPGVYTRVDKVSEWIQTVINEEK